MNWQKKKRRLSKHRPRWWACECTCRSEGTSEGRSQQSRPITLYCGGHLVLEESCNFYARRIFDFFCAKRSCDGDKVTDEVGDKKVVDEFAVKKVVDWSSFAK